jgi:hypothetical protein
MADPNIHVRAARAHLERATAPAFIDDTMRGLLARITRLETGLQSIVTATTVDSDDDPLAKSTKAWIRGLALGVLEEKTPTESGLSGSASRNADRSGDGGADISGITKRWIIVRKPGCVPEVKSPITQTHEGAVEMLRELTRCRPEGTTLTLCALTWNNELWATDGREELAIVDAR